MADISPYKRDLPFIHRAWKTAVDHLSPYSMGIKLSSANDDNGISGDHGPRAPKRRRIVNDSPDSTPNGAVGHLLPEMADDFEKALRVEVLQITHKDSSSFRSSNLLNGTGSPAKKDIPSIRVRCKLSIFRWRVAKEIRVLYCDSQLCSLKVFRDSDDVCRRARIYLNSPFHVPADKIYVERDDNRGFALADHYLVQAELESAGDPAWPPIDLLPKEETHDILVSRPQHWVLSSQVVYRFEKHRTSAPIKIRKKVGTEAPLDLMMDMDLRWSACHRPGSTTDVEVSPPETRAQVEDGALEPLTNGYINGRVDHWANDFSKDDQDTLMEEDEEAEEATTPSRSLRTRGKPQNYNLKLLSDKARGKERKERKERKQRKAADAKSHGDQVTWITPQGKKVPLEDYQCIRCFAVNSSMGQLIKHIRVHPEFKYDVDPDTSRIWVTDHGQETPRRSRSAQIDISSLDDDDDSDLGDDISPQRAQRILKRPKPSQVISHGL